MADVPEELCADPVDHLELIARGLQRRGVPWRIVAAMPNVREMLAYLCYAGWRYEIATNHLYPPP
jgi:hypothetical protein